MTNANQFNRADVNEGDVVTIRGTTGYEKLQVVGIFVASNGNVTLETKKEGSRSKKTSRTFLDGVIQIRNAQGQIKSRVTATSELAYQQHLARLGVNSAL